jgi:RNA polymerase sigma-70 factor (ECF subfamily)
MAEQHPSGSREGTDPAGWVDRYGDQLYGYALFMVQDPSTAQDLVQETFLAALNSRERFKGLSQEKTWLFGILKHKILDHMRRKGRERQNVDDRWDASFVDEFFQENGDWSVRPGKWHTNPDSQFRQREFASVLRECLAQMSQRLARVFTLREMEGLSTPSICEAMGITPNNFWTMIYRARMALRQCLERNWFAAGEGTGETREK